MFYRSGWLRCVLVISMCIGARFWFDLGILFVLGWILSCVDVRCIVYIILLLLYYYTYIHIYIILLLYIIILYYTPLIYLLIYLFFLLYSSILFSPFLIHPPIFKSITLLLLLFLLIFFGQSFLSPHLSSPSTIIKEYFWPRMFYRSGWLRCVVRICVFGELTWIVLRYSTVFYPRLVFCAGVTLGVIHT